MLLEEQILNDVRDFPVAPDGPEHRAEHHRPPGPSSPATSATTTLPAAQRPVEQLRDGLAAGPGRAGVTAVALDARQAGTESGAGLAWRRARANAPAWSPEAVRACDQ
jgi:hypothetical protein